mgnify:CR=1 FL=1
MLHNFKDCYSHFTVIVLLVLFAIGNTTPCIGQVDSLLQELNTTSDDSLKYDVLVKLAIELEPSNSDSSFKYYHAAANLTQGNNWHKKTGNVYYNMGMFTHYTLWSDTCIQLVRKAAYWYRKANYPLGVLNCQFTEGTYWMNFEILDSAITNLEKAATYGQEINDTLYLHKIYNNLGLAYQYTGQLEKAIAYMLLSIQEKKKYTPNRLASAFINLGVNYLNTSNSTEAIYYFKKGYEESVKLEYQLGMGLSLKNTGDAFAQDHLLDSTFYYYKKAKSVFVQMNDSNHISRYYMSTSEVLANQGLTQQAADSLEMAIAYFPSNGSPRLKIHTLITQCNFKLSDSPNSLELTKIEEMALEAYQLSQKTGLIQETARASKLLFSVYSMTRKNGLAVQYGETYMRINDSLFNEQQSEALAEQRTKFETEKKEIEIDFLNKENQLKSIELAQNAQLQEKQQTIIYLLVFGVIITLVFIGIVFKLYSKQQRTNHVLIQKNTLIQKQNSEKEILLKEIHHRVKNNLQIIWSLLDLQSHSIDDPGVKLAITDGKNRINSMSMIHQMLYQNDDAGNIQFKDYLHQLILQIKSTFTNASDTEIILNVPEGLQFDMDTSIPLGLIINEIITNAFKYAFTNHPSKIIRVEVISLGSNQFQLKISDNGVGFPENFDITKSKSLGLRLVKNLSKQLKGNLEIESENGTTFIIHFKGKTFKLEN